MKQHNISPIDKKPNPKQLQKAYEEYLETVEYDRTINLERIPLEKHLEKSKTHSTTAHSLP